MAHLHQHTLRCIILTFLVDMSDGCDQTSLEIYSRMQLRSIECIVQLSMAQTTLSYPLWCVVYGYWWLWPWLIKRATPWQCYIIDCRRVLPWPPGRSPVYLLSRWNPPFLISGQIWIVHLCRHCCIMRQLCPVLTLEVLIFFLKTWRPKGFFNLKSSQMS